MEQDRVETALARIEAAAARIEAASARAPATGNPELSRKHEQLRASVTASIGELDALIGKLSG